MPSRPHTGSNPSEATCHFAPVGGYEEINNPGTKSDPWYATHRPSEENLADLGFEKDADWYKSLPDRSTVAGGGETLSGDELLRQSAAFENQHLELERWRTAAEDRLNDVDRLTAMVRNLERTCEERLADNSKLSATIQQLQTALQERLSDVDTLTRNVHDLEARIARPDPVAEERLHDIQKLTSIIRILESGIADMQAEQARSLGYRTYRLGLGMYSRLERICR